MTEYVTLVPQGGQPVRLGNQTGAPWPTTGTGSLVFSDGATLTNVVFDGVSYTGPTTLSTLTVTGLSTLADVLGASFNRVVITAPATTATLTLANNSSLTTVGAYSTTFTMTGATALTLPTSGTLATLAGTEALTNKTYNGNTWTAGSSTLTLGGNLVTSGAYNLTATLTANTSVTFPTTGTLSVNPTMSSKTADYAIPVDDNPSDFDNTGAVTTVTFTLPVSVVGDVFSFTVTEAQSVVVAAPAGVYIYVEDLASTSGGSFTATGKGAYLLLKCRSATTWYAQARLGSWAPA